MRHLRKMSYSVPHRVRHRAVPFPFIASLPHINACSYVSCMTNYRNAPIEATYASCAANLGVDRALDGGCSKATRQTKAASVLS